MRKINILAFQFTKHKGLNILLQTLSSYAIALLLLTSCGVYKKNIMLRVDQEINVSEGNKTSWDVEANYVIQPNDRITVDVYTNNGERIIDPDFELSRDIGVNQTNVKPKFDYLINSNGEVRLPMIGVVALHGLTINEAEIRLQDLFSKFYDSPYVHLTFTNKRVTVLGDVNAVVPLDNENISMYEVLARADAINNNVNIQNIRLVRGEYIYQADLSTKEGIELMNMIIQPGDVIYVEPIRRPFIESIRDYGPFISVISSITAIIAILAIR